MHSVGYNTVAIFLAHRTNGRAYAKVLRLSVTLCIVDIRCVLEQKLLLTAYRKSYTRNRLVPKRTNFNFVRGRLRSREPLRHIRH